jgi:hypothetical protein
LSVVLIAATLCLSACSKTPGDGRFGRPNQGIQTGTAAGTTAQNSAGQPDQSQILAAQANHQRNVELTVSGRVARLLPDDTRGLPHERFLLQLDNGTRVLVAHDTKLAPRVPLQEGDFVRIRGEYIWNQKGGVIHWTHHSPNGRHEPGWIEFNGNRYE